MPPHPWLAALGYWDPAASGLGGRSGSFFGAGEVRLAILALLADGPKNGYELMKELRVRSGGSYRMSAGTVYPTLQQLEDEGLIVPAPRDRKKLFEIADAGRQELAREKTKVDNIWQRASDWGDWSQWMGPEAVMISKPLAAFMKAAFRAVKQSGGERDRINKVYEVLDRARKELEDL